MRTLKGPTKFYLKRGGKVGDRRAKKRASKWVGGRSTTVTGSKRHRKMMWI